MVPAFDASVFAADTASALRSSGIAIGRTLRLATVVELFRADADISLSIDTALERQQGATRAIADNVGQAVHAGADIEDRARRMHDKASGLGDDAGALHDLSDTLDQSAARLHDRATRFVEIAGAR